MTKVESLQEQIKALSPAEFAELRDWLIEWDRQIERDAGKLVKQFKRA